MRSGVPLQRQVEDGQIHQAVQRIELALDGAAALGVDDRPAGRVDDVARRNHIAAAEEHDGVAVGVRRRLVNDLNAFAVQVHRVQPVGERLRRPERERDGPAGPSPPTSASARFRAPARWPCPTLETRSSLNPAPAATAPGRMLSPALASFSLPPTWSASMLVLMM